MPFTYHALVERVVDADTVILFLDLGFRVYHRVTVRLTGVFAPELKTSKGKASAAAVKKAIEGKYVIATTRRWDRYGRWLAELTDETGKSINKRIITIINDELKQ